MDLFASDVEKNTLYDPLVEQGVHSMREKVELTLFSLYLILEAVI